LDAGAENIFTSSPESASQNFLKLKNEVPQRLILVNKEIYHLVVFFVDYRFGIAFCLALVIQIILCAVRKFLGIERVCI
jgi:hypothetical protein